MTDPEFEDEWANVPHDTKMRFLLIEILMQYEALTTALDINNFMRTSPRNKRLIELAKKELWPDEPKGI